jgi:hypothetical protein
VFDRRTSMLPAVFDPAFSAIQRPETYTLLFGTASWRQHAVCVYFVGSKNTVVWLRVTDEKVISHWSSEFEVWFSGDVALLLGHSRC